MLIPVHTTGYREPLEPLGSKQVLPMVLCGTDGLLSGGEYHAKIFGMGAVEQVGLLVFPLLSEWQSAS